MPATIKVRVTDEGSTKSLMTRTISPPSTAHALFEIEKIRRDAQGKFGTERTLLFHYAIDGKSPPGFKAFMKKDEAIFVNHELFCVVTQ